MLPGFHPPRTININVEKSDHSLWHYFDQKDEKIHLVDRSLTGKLVGFYLKPSLSDKVRDKSGIPGLRGVLIFLVDAGKEKYKYLVSAGLDTLFFRTALIALAAVPNHASDITLELWLSKEGNLNCSILNPQSLIKYRGKQYGDGWEGLDYEGLIWTTLKRFRATSNSFELLGIPDQEWIYPENRLAFSIIQKACSLNPQWIKEYFEDNFYKGVGNCTPMECEEALTHWAELIPTKLTPDEAVISWQRQRSLLPPSLPISDLCSVFTDWVAANK